MKKLIILLSTLFIFACCSISRELETVTVNIWPKKYQLDIPKGYQMDVWEDISVQEFIYQDSSCVYAGSIDTPINSDNVLQQYGDSVYHLRYDGRIVLRLVQAFLEGEGRNPRDRLNIPPDTMDLRGQSSDNLFWREILYGDTLCVGYKNVPKEKVAKYDSIILGIRLK